MKDKLLKKFALWWETRRHTRPRIRGLPLSELTLDRYLRILKKTPDFEITEKTNVDDLLYQLKKWLQQQPQKYPQFLFAIRTYIKMYEDDPNPIVVNKAKYLRTGLKLTTPYGGVKYTQKIFLEKALTKEEIRKIIKDLENITLPYQIQPEKAKLFFQLLYDTGCRIREFSQIKVSDILPSGEIKIEGKGKYIRYVRAESSTLPLLKKFIKNIELNETLFGWKTETMKKYFKEILKIIAFTKPKSTAEKLKKISPHWFRHSRATHLAIVKKDVIWLKNYMGWSDIKMAETYVTEAPHLLRAMSFYQSTDLWQD